MEIKLRHILFVEVVFVSYWLLFMPSLGGVIGAAHAILGGVFWSYPSPGYPLFFLPAILVGIEPYAFSLIAQNILCLLGIWLWMKEFNVEFSYFVLPFIACMALTSTAAVPCFLVLCAVILLRRERVWTAALLIGLAGFFRPELFFLMLPPLILSGYVRQGLTVLVGSYLLFFALTGTFTASNVPGTFYVALGQMGTNEWNIPYSDAYVDSLAQANGVQALNGTYAYGPQGGEFYRKLSIEAIQSHPMEYVRKLANNGLRAAFFGPYVGDWRLYPWTRWPVKYPLSATFSLVMLWAIWRVWRLNTPVSRFLMWCCVLLVIGQAVGNWFPRHWNAIYFPMLGLAIGGKK